MRRSPSPSRPGFRTTLTGLVLLLLLTLPGSGHADPLGPSSRRTGWTISEIMYHPAPRADARNLEFVELYNAGLIAEDLAGYRLAGSIDFLFPSNTVVPAGGFAVVAASPADVAAIHGLDNVLGPYLGQLGNSATLRLFNPAGALLLETSWTSRPPWPVAPAGAGPSLVLSRPSLGEGDPRAWSGSALVGGSPGRTDLATAHPWAGVVINEVLAHTDPPQPDFVELHNHTRAAVDLSDCRLTDDPARPGFRIPAGTSLPAGGFAAFTETELGFALQGGGETLLLFNPDGTRLIDAVRFEAQARGVASGRSPDGSPDFVPLERPTPAAANARPGRADVVISEILYHPISDDDDDQFVEIHNRGTNTVEVGGWRFVDGIDFEFPAGTRLAPGADLAVARNLGRLLAGHPALSPAGAVGDFRGSLSRRGERLALARPQVIISTNAGGIVVTNREWVVISEVTYRDGGDWGSWADGGGSSLELRDVRADPRFAGNWADSDETAKSAWTTIQTTGTLDLGAGTSDRLQIVTLGAGACLVDDIEVVGSGGNLIANGTFDQGITRWTAQGTLDGSRWEPSEGAAAPGSLRVEAVARGDTGANRIQTPLASNPSAGTTATIRAKARWLRGHPEILLRLRGNYLEAAGTLTLPTNLGTPGSTNSRALANAGPSVTELTQTPVLPAASQAVTVTARIQDPDGVGAVTLRYRVDPATTTSDLAMVDDGTGADAWAGDGIYTATLPGQAGGKLVAYQVLANDQASTPARTGYPANEALVRWGESRPSGNLGTYRFWMTQATFNRWSSRPKLDNTPLPITFVYNDERVVHGVTALFAGSPHISPGYSTPSGNLCGYTINFPPDQPFLGTTDVVLDWPGRDTTAQQEPMAYWIARELGVPFNHRRFIHLHVNGVTEVSRGSIYEDAQQVNSDLAASWNPDAGGGGDLYKIEQWFEFDDGINTAQVIPPRLENYVTTGGAKKAARYRWSWLKRAVHGSASDFRTLYTLVDAANTAAAGLYPGQLLAFADLEEWMRIFATEHIVVNLDSWGYDIGKNMYAYKPPGGRWQLHMWDIDWVMLASAQHGYSPTSPLMYRGGAVFGESNRDPVVGRMYADPTIQRAYWRAIEDAVNGPLRPERVAARMDSTYAALVAQGVTRSSGGSLSTPAPVKTWLGQRRTFLQQQLNEVRPSFLLQTPAAVVTGPNLLALRGTAPFAVTELRINGRPSPVTWTSLSNWTASVVLEPGPNALVVTGWDRFGNPVPGANGAANVRYDGIPASPVGTVVLNEIQYHPAVSGAGFVELFNRSTNTTFDLTGWRLEDTGLEFPTGSLLAPQAYLLVAADRQALATAHGIAPVVAAEFPGQLPNAGATLSLVRPGTNAATDTLVNRVTYNDAPPWPAGADGTGASLQLIDPSLDNRRPGSWAVFTTNTPAAATPRTLVPLTAVWRYNASGDDLGVDWREFAYDDHAWPSGGALLYNETAELPGPKVTPLKLGAITFYFRTDFTFDGDPARTDLRLSTIVDDALVLYLNGTELFRLGFPPASAISAATLSSRNVSDAALEGPFVVPGNLLRRGTNILAAEVHQVAAASSDITFGLSLETSPAAVPNKAATPGAANATGLPVPALLPLWLNEFQAVNQTGPRDAAGERDPWVELLNTGDATVRLAGTFLSNDPTHPDLWPLPDLALGAGQRLVVWLDAQPGQSTATEPHAGFRPAASAGSLVLSQKIEGATHVLDALDYASLAPDLVVGLLPDGDPDHRTVLAQATPGTANSGAPSPAGVVINEWLASNTHTLADPADGRFDDWFELHNPTSRAIDLTGCWLSDDAADLRKFAVPAGTTLPAHGFLLVWADGDPGQNAAGAPLHTNFKLSQAGETIVLTGPDERILDQVTFGAQPDDLSGGRWPDGGPIATATLARPTPGTPNAGPGGAGGEVALTAVVRGADGSLTITWTSVAGAVYQLQASPALEPADWANTGSPISATGTTASASDHPGASVSARFYRVVRMGL